MQNVLAMTLSRIGYASHLLLGLAAACLVLHCGGNDATPGLREGGHFSSSSPLESLDRLAAADTPVFRISRAVVSATVVGPPRTLSPSPSVAQDEPSVEITEFHSPTMKLGEPATVAGILRNPLDVPIADVHIDVSHICTAEFIEIRLLAGDSLLAHSEQDWTAQVVFQRDHFPEMLGLSTYANWYTALYH